MMESIGDDRESGKALEKLSLVREKVESAKRAKTQGVREHNAGGDYPVRPRGNPQPLGVLLLIIFNAY